MVPRTVGGLWEYTSCLLKAPLATINYCKDQFPGAGNQSPILLPDQTAGNVVCNVLWLCYHVTMVTVCHQVDLKGRHIKLHFFLLWKEQLQDIRLQTSISRLTFFSLRLFNMFKLNLYRVAGQIVSCIFICSQMNHPTKSCFIPPNQFYVFLLCPMTLQNCISMDIMYTILYYLSLFWNKLI